MPTDPSAPVPSRMQVVALGAGVAGAVAVSAAQDGGTGKVIGAVVGWVVGAGAFLTVGHVVESYRRRGR